MSEVNSNNVSDNNNVVVEGHFNQLTPAQLERLALLAEECAGVIQVVGKIIRHGYNSYHPKDGTMTNVDYLEKELGNVTYAVNAMAAAGDIEINTVNLNSADKAVRVQQYLHHQESPGVSIG